MSPSRILATFSASVWFQWSFISRSCLSFISIELLHLPHQRRSHSVRRKLKLGKIKETTTCVHICDLLTSHGPHRLTKRIPRRIIRFLPMKLSSFFIAIGCLVRWLFRFYLRGSNRMLRYSLALFSLLKPTRLKSSHHNENLKLNNLPVLKSYSRADLCGVAQTQAMRPPLRLFFFSENIAYTN